MTTPAKCKGLVIGKEYIYQSNGEGSYCGNDGATVTFRGYDGSESPAFNVPTSMDHDGWCYLTLEYICEKEGAKTTPLTYRVEVTGNETNVSTNRVLSQTQIKRIIDIIGE